MEKHGKSVSLFVEETRLKDSIHASMACVDCHTGLSIRDLPHAKTIEPVRCQTCHAIAGFEKSVHGMTGGCQTCHGSHEIRSIDDPKSSTNRIHVSGTCARCHQEEQKKFLTSAHSTALASGSKAAPSCVDCHGAHDISPVESSESPLFRTREAGVCLKCHLENRDIRKQVGVAAGFVAGYQTSVHGVALASGNLKAAACSDCHGSHDLRKASDPSSRVNKQNIAETCARCHPGISKTYSGSIHGTVLKKGNVDAPACTDCHGEHEIYARSDPRARVAAKNVSEQVCAKCHNSVQLNRKYGMPSGLFETYSDSYHGLAARAGSVEVANCASCHGVHNIKPSSDPASTVNRVHLAATCGRCHPGANKNFARGSVHVTVARNSGGAVLYWIRAFYISLIVLVVGSMFLHNLLDFLKRARHRLALRQGRIAPERYAGMQHVRMTLNERIQHAALLISFILLVLTGFMLRFPDAWWVIPIRQLSGSFFAVRSVTHRVAGVLMIAISLYHLFYLFFTKRGRQFRTDMLPRRKDAIDVWANLRYLMGLSKNRPLFDRFGYIEKAEYWALIWGVVIMAATGIVMWFDNYFIGLFTKLGWDISRTIHFYEACLATLAIVVWHFYFVLFSPDVYPMSTSWLTGKISEEEMAQEHPLELARIKSLQTEQEPATQPETPSSQEPPRG
jgi:formate dehydrogenase gamma subunit